MQSRIGTPCARDFVEFEAVEPDDKHIDLACTQGTDQLGVRALAASNKISAVNRLTILIQYADDRAQEASDERGWSRSICRCQRWHALRAVRSTG